MSADELEQFKGLSVCPNCGCIDQKGTYRCLGCGTFHSGAHLVEREAPPVKQDIEALIVEPSAYSLGPNEKILEETFEQSESVREWSGGSTDFSVEDDTDKEKISTSKEQNIPQNEEL